MEDRKVGFWLQYWVTLKSNSPVIVISAMVVLLAWSVWLFFPELHENSDQFSLSVEAIMLVLVFLGIRLPQMRNKWVEDMPNYINVEYCYENKKVVEVLMVPLSSVANAREQAQALIKSLNKNTNVDLEPMLKKFSHGEIYRSLCKKCGQTPQYFERHTATIELSKPLPEQNGQLSEYGVKPGEEYLQWDISNEDKTSNKTIINFQTGESRSLTDNEELKNQEGESK